MKGEPSCDSVLISLSCLRKEFDKQLADVALSIASKESDVEIFHKTNMNSTHQMVQQILLVCFHEAGKLHDRRYAAGTKLPRIFEDMTGSGKELHEEI